MAIDFYIANEIKEIHRDSEYVFLDEEIKNKLYTFSSWLDLHPGLILLLELDPYGDEILNLEKIRAIIEGTEKENIVDLDEDIIRNLQKINSFFKKALEKNKNICVIGD